MASLIDGKLVAAEVRQDIAEQVRELSAKYKRKPGLAVVMVGDQKDSQTYVRLKGRAAEECGMVNFTKLLAADATQEELEGCIRQLDENPEVDGIILQLPIPKHLDAGRAVLCIDPAKDVDGIHPMNVGHLCSRELHPQFVSCTPLGVMSLLNYSGVEFRGKNAVVLGRSSIVGIPVSQLLMRADSTVTVCHHHTQNVGDIVSRADIVVAAVRHPNFVRGDWIKPGAAVIDVGTNPVDDSSKKSGYRLVGDVNFDECKAKAGCITPVPGGVGPMTIAMLLANTLQGYKRGVGAPPAVVNKWAKHIPRILF